MPLLSDEEANRLYDLASSRLKADDARWVKVLLADRTVRIALAQG